MTWPGGPAAGHIAVGCTEGRTERRAMLPEGPQLLMLQLATWGVLKYRDLSAAPLLSLLRGKKLRDKNIYKLNKYGITV